MMGWLLSFLPRVWLSDALAEQWARNLPRAERNRFYYWGATGNPEHHEFQWADKITRLNAATQSSEGL